MIKENFANQLSFNQVSVFVSRDLDSIMGDREESAVTEWLRSSMNFHFMRDHPDHNATILAGMWGVKLQNPDIREKISKAWSNAMKDPVTWAERTDSFSDQIFLDR